MHCRLATEDVGGEWVDVSANGEGDMTEIREQAFSIDLPGLWESDESQDPGSLVYRKTDGPEVLTVMLLSVRPMFAIADQARLLGDYASHRLKYERGRAPALEQSVPVVEPGEESVEVSWEGRDRTEKRQHRHRAVLLGNLLADFCFESSLSNDDSFDTLARAVLSTARVSGQQGDQGA